MTTPYSYARLKSCRDEIRLLEILSEAHTSSATQNVAVHCTLKHVLRDDKPVYLALSYVWGDVSHTKPITVNGTVVHITENLEAALRYLSRSGRGTIPLWADALCINQLDNGEKSEQVQQMRNIYRDAAHVLVWLGTAGHDSDMTMDMIEQFSKELDGLGATSYLADIAAGSYDGENQEEYASAKERVDYMLARVFQSHDVIRSASTGYHSIMARPWWRRVWVFQEFCLAREVVFSCGEKELPWVHMEAGLMFFHLLQLHIGRMALDLVQRESMDRDLFESLISMVKPFNRQWIMMMTLRSQKSAYFDTQAFIELLTATCVLEEQPGYVLEATDPRDKVFGFLGFVDSVEELGIRADYSKSCETVYIETARMMLRHGYVDCLALCQSPTPLAELPSWVPDWRKPMRKPLGHMAAEGCFHASGQSTPSVHFQHPGASINILRISGARMDVVKWLGSQWAPIIGEKQYDSTAMSILLGDIENLCRQSSEISGEAYRSIIQRADSVWRIATVDTEMPLTSRRRRATSLSEQGYQALKRSIESPADIKDTITTEMAIYYSGIKQSLYRRPFLSAQGYVGLGPEHMQIDDVIYVLFGANQPFVMREAQVGKFELIGEVYVHGFMDGELMDANHEIEVIELK